ncbi:MAG: hypothetical protein H0U34_08380, partial [Sphingomonas sp.]|nr:hypothetical protein [Sphingomonas sp.]
MRRILLIIAAGAIGSAAQSQPVPPAAQPHVDHAHGVEIPDEYRWMETAGKSLDPWIDAEDAHARVMLDSLPGRKVLEERIAELWRSGSGDLNESLIDERAGRRLVMDYSLDRPRLGLRGADGRLTILFDGTADGPEKGASLRRSATKLSPDGRFVTLGLVERGEDRPRLRILDVASRQLLPDRLDQPLWADGDGMHITWLPDSSGLLWARNPSRTAATTDGEREFNGHIYLHRLGTDSASDAALFGLSLVAEIRADDTPYPGISPDARWLVIRLRHTEGRSLWAAPFAGGRVTAPFRKVFATDGTISGWGVKDDNLWAVLPDGAPGHALYRAPLGNPAAHPQMVANGKNGVLSGLAVAGDALYASQRDGAVSSLWRLSEDGRREEIALPRPGVIDRLEPGAGAKGARLRLRSALHPDEWVHVLPGAVATLPMLPAPTGLPPGLAGLAVTVVHAPARDGALVPVSLLHNKTQRRDGGGFVRIETYGCFGSTREFIYDPANLAWLERGGMLAIAHVRGG